RYQAGGGKAVEVLVRIQKKWADRKCYTHGNCEVAFDLPCDSWRIAKPRVCVQRVVLVRDLDSQLLAVHLERAVFVGVDYLTVNSLPASRVVFFGYRRRDRADWDTREKQNCKATEHGRHSGNEKRAEFHSAR